MAVTFLADIPRTSRELFDATADMSPEDARALQAEKLRRDLTQVEQIDRVLSRGLIRPEPEQDHGWMWPAAAILGALAALIGVAL